MDLQFFESDQLPLPPEQVRVAEAMAAPYPDRRRIKVVVGLTPFLQRPDVEIRVVDPAGETLAEASVIECADRRFELTLHLRQLPPTATACRLEATVCYPDLQLASTFTHEFSLAAPIG